MTMGAYKVNDNGALEWDADAPSENIEIEHPLGQTTATPVDTEVSGDDAEDDDALPSRAALMALSKEDLETYAEQHGVDPTGATKQQIVDTLYENG